MEPPIIVASNRGPVAFARAADGAVEERRGVGGLVTAVSGAIRDRDAAWIAAPITDEDRARVDAGDDRFDLPLGSGTVHVRFASIEPDTYDAYYNEFSNRILWFLHHYLWDASGTPEFGEEDEAAWTAYRSVAERFATLMTEAAAPEAVAAPQDYHLSLVPGLLRARRPDLAITHFWHIPFCQPDQFAILPDEWGRALLEGMLGADIVGFHAARWAANFLACCREILGARVRGRVVSHGGRSTRVGVYPIGVEVDSLAADANQPAVDEALAELDAVVGRDRKLILRVDRTELSKNIVRGFVAYERLLHEHPELHGTVVHLARLSPSRVGVPEYEAYMDEVRARADRINERFATPDWTPLILDVSDDFVRTLAAYRRYDVLLVNPVYDGMNLVAREGPLVNERDGVLVLSRNAGAAAELEPAALMVNPFDPRGTARELAQALQMPPEERAERAHTLRPLAAGRPPERWLAGQITDLRRSRGA